MKTQYLNLKLCPSFSSSWCLSGWWLAREITWYFPCNLIGCCMYTTWPPLCILLICQLNRSFKICLWWIFLVKNCCLQVAYWSLKAQMFVGSKRERTADTAELKFTFEFKWRFAEGSFLIYTQILFETSLSKIQWFLTPPHQDGMSVGIKPAIGNKMKNLNLRNTKAKAARLPPSSPISL